MAVVLPKFRLFYASVPKVACTSLKHMFFEAENGFAFRPYVANGQKKHIHNVVYRGLLRKEYPEKRIANFDRVTVVRDPIKRLVSAYRNRAIEHRELSIEKVGAKLEELDLAPTPSLTEFIDKLELYIQASPAIFRHTRPLVDFIGPAPDYFSRVYRMQDLNEFMSDMNERMGTQLSLGQLQTGGPKVDADSLSSRQIKKLKTFYESDYTAYRKYF